MTYNNTIEAKQTYLRANIGWLHLLPQKEYDDVFAKIFGKRVRTNKALAEMILSVRTDLFPLIKNTRSRFWPTSGVKPITAIEAFVSRVDSWTKHCNHDCKFMYFCDLEPGHTGSHSEKGLVW
jgi:hypothetical protein